MALKLVRKVDRKKDIFELRINTEGIFARSLFFRLEKANEEEDNVASPTYIITNSFKKKTNKTPSKELKKAIKRKSNYKNKRWHKLDSRNPVLRAEKDSTFKTGL